MGFHHNVALAVRMVLWALALSIAPLASWAVGPPRESIAVVASGGDANSLGWRQIGP